MCDTWKESTVADATNTTPPEVQTEGIAQATEQTITQLTNGDFSALGGYATQPVSYTHLTLPTKA